MQEIELKILDIDIKEIEKKLIKLGADKISTNLVSVNIFDFEDSRIKKKRELLRLRQIGDKIELTHKGKRKEDIEFKISEETETTVESFEEMKKILEKIGLICINESEKTRTSFKIGKTKIEIDQHPKIPPYLEIEGTKEDIEDIVKKLGFSMNDTCDLTGSKVIKKYGVNPKNLKFETNPIR